MSEHAGCLKRRPDLGIYWPKLGWPRALRAHNGVHSSLYKLLGVHPRGGAFWAGLARPGQAWPGLAHMGQKGPKGPCMTASLGRPWPALAQMGQNGPFGPMAQMAKTGQNRSKTGPKMAQNQWRTGT